MDYLTRWWGSGLLIALLAQGCSFGDVDVARRNCPCIAGYVCNTATNVCEVISDAGIDAPVDAIPDANIPDRTIDVVDDATPDADATIDAEVEDADSAVRMCEGLSSVLCEDFEDPNLNSNYLVRKGPSDSFELSSMAHTGNQSLKITNVLGSDFAEFNFDGILPPSTEETWVRAWFYMPDDQEGIALLDLKGSTGSYAIYSEGPPYSSLASNNYTPEVVANFGSAIPAMEWFCLEMRVNYDGPRFVQAYVNSLLSAFTEQPLTEPLTDMHIGVIYRNPADPDVVLYLDDLVVSNTRIGCD